MGALRVVVDGAPLPDEAARAFWKRFSDWMEAHQGDLAGFAQAEGFASVHPEMHGTGPTLIVSRTAPQTPYAPAPHAPHPGDPPRSRAEAADARRPKKRRNR